MLALTILVVLFTAAGMGLLLSHVCKDPLSAMAASNAFYALAVVLAPVYYPLEILPETISKVLIALPTVASAQLVKNVAGVSSYMLTESLISLTSWLVLLTTTNTILWRRASKE
ncbi:hypothetical protein [Pyrolobus fumarii]|uniref:hypothetical protein n=1 Tax=Pyrolobus fumarii TaxID=54252 RepID=UPI00064F5BEF|nr:hypothetical protein [Pyrolobus fumarii]